MQIEKDYFTLAEIIERWGISEADLIYLTENDRLRLSVRVFHLPTEFGGYEMTAEGRGFRVPYEQSRFSGLLDLHACDAFQVFRCGELQVSEFRTPSEGYASVRDDTDSVLVMIGDLLIRREERDRFEAEAATAPPAQPASFTASPGYQDVVCDGHRLRLGPIQAEVVRVLHAAALAGSPWCSGKAILSAAGSRSLKMSDVFKSQPHWRRLITSNRRGLYRLNCGR
jgi:hypothetical protein